MVGHESGEQDASVGPVGTITEEREEMHVGYGYRGRQQQQQGKCKDKVYPPPFSLGSSVTHCPPPHRILYSGTPCTLVKLME